MTPHLHALLITGPGVPEALLSLHTKPQQARDALARQAAELTREQVGFVPTWAQLEHPDEAQARELVDGLYGLGWRVTLGEYPVEL